MTLTYTRSPTGTEHAQWVDCPFCGDDIDDHESFRQHWQHCPRNPNNQETNA